MRSGNKFVNDISKKSFREFRSEDTTKLSNSCPDGLRCLENCIDAGFDCIRLVRQILEGLRWIHKIQIQARKLICDVSPIRGCIVQLSSRTCSRIRYSKLGQQLRNFTGNVLRGLIRICKSQRRVADVDEDGLKSARLIGHEL